MIKVQNLSFSVGRKEILKSVNLQAYAGELLAIIGPNGAGKSTLLKLLCKEISSPREKIYINNKDICDYSYKQMALFRSVLAQSNQVSIDFNSQELVTMGRYPHYDTNPTANDMKIVNDVIMEMGISHLKERSYHTLSGGEQQRVQLARVLAQIYDRPDGILFLDEPINGLDIQYQQIILQTAKKMAQKGFTVVCILHDINFAARFADNILIMKEGIPIDYGKPSEVISEENIWKTYQTKVKLIQDPKLDHPIIIPVY